MILARLLNQHISSCSACAQVTSHQRYHHRCNCNHGGNAAGHLQDGVSWHIFFWSPKIVQNLLSTTTSVSRVLVKKVHDCHIIYFSNLLSALLRFNSQLFTSFSFIFAWWSVFEFSVWEILWFRTFSKHIFSFFFVKKPRIMAGRPPHTPNVPPLRNKDLIIAGLIKGNQRLLKPWS